MTKLVIYTNRCVSCRDRVMYKKVKRFAEWNGYNLEIRRTDRNKFHKLQSLENSTLDLPYIFNPQNNKSIRLGGNLDLLV